MGILMFGSSVGKKALMRSMEPVILAFQSSVKEALGERSDRDGTLMFMGFVHYAIAYYITNKAHKINSPLWMSSHEIRDI